MSLSLFQFFGYSIKWTIVARFQTWKLIKILLSLCNTQQVDLFKEGTINLRRQHTSVKKTQLRVKDCHVITTTTVTSSLQQSLRYKLQICPAKSVQAAENDAQKQRNCLSWRSFFTARRRPNPNLSFHRSLARASANLSLHSVISLVDEQHPLSASCLFAKQHPEEASAKPTKVTV